MRRGQNTNGRITKPVKIFLLNLKLTQFEEKIKNYLNKWVKHVR
jgi:hypothetical protein